MAENKDHPSVVRFLALFSELRGKIGDNPEKLESLTTERADLRKLCDQLFLEQFDMVLKEREYKELYARPVDDKFLKAWRDYEEKYDLPISRIALGVIINEDNTQVGTNDINTAWHFADIDAKVQANMIHDAIAFAEDQVSQEHREFEENFQRTIENGCEAWRNLCQKAGFDLRGVFRRRQIVPFVLIPRHVSDKYGYNEKKVSLFTNLKQAQDSYIYGVPFAAIALLRSILEVTLRDHYGSQGNGLEDLIKNCPCLPKKVSQKVLHDLRVQANNILHVDRIETVQNDLEKRILGYFLEIRCLIEAAPK